MELFEKKVPTKYVFLILLIIVVVEIATRIDREWISGTAVRNNSPTVKYVTIDKNSIKTVKQTVKEYRPVKTVKNTTAEVIRKVMIPKVNKPVEDKVQKLSPEEDKKEPTRNPIPVCPKFFKGNGNICENSPGLTYLLYVHSAPGNVIRRNNQRHTWANSKFLKDNKMKVMFVIGRPTDKNLQTQLDAESLLNKDILQGDFVDSYHNLTLKALFALGFISERCSNIKYVLKIDDDIFVNVFKIIELIQQSEKTSKSLLICPQWIGMGIIRDPKSKWYVKKEEFPGKNTFPPYCSGHFYMATLDVITAMFKASKRTRFFWVDDVYITGLLVNKAKKDVKFKTVSIIKNFLMEPSKVEKLYADKSKPITQYVTSVDDPKQYLRLFGLMMTRLTDEEKSLVNVS